MKDMMIDIKGLANKRGAFLSGFMVWVILAAILLLVAFGIYAYLKTDFFEGAIEYINNLFRFKG